MVEKLGSVGFAKPGAEDKHKRTLLLSALAAALVMGCEIAHAAAPAAAPPRPPASFGSPRDAVVALYRLPSIPVTPADKQRFFAGNLAAALVRDSERDDEVGVANDSDYRYDAQDFRIAGLHIAAMTVHGAAAGVRVAFSNFGKPGTVSYDLCQRRPGDWRIRDVITPSGGSLRKLLGLAPPNANTGC